MEKTTRFGFIYVLSGYKCQSRKDDSGVCIAQIGIYRSLIGSLRGAEGDVAP